LNNTVLSQPQDYTRSHYRLKLPIADPRPFSFWRLKNGIAVEKLECNTRVYVATPYGKEGRGGIDRLNDSIFDAMVQRHEFRFDLVRLVTRGKRGLLAAQFVFAYALLRFMVEALRGEVDLLHIHLSIRGSSYRKVVLGAVARHFAIPYVVHLHGIHFREFWSSCGPLLAAALDRLFSGSTQIIVLGQYWSDVITDRLPGSAEKISILSNAAAEPPDYPLPRSDDATRITFLGQLGDRKGTPELVAALAGLSRSINWVATIAGDGEVERTRTDVQMKGISNWVEVPGWIDVQARNDLLRRTDILVLPSFSENLPMVIIEAFSYGIPVIATPVGAIPEVIEHGRTGLLVPVGDVGALRNAMEVLLSDLPFRARLGSEAKNDFASRYELGSYVDRLAAIWRKAVEKKSCGEGKL
jgi:glycosyltransferase involved in cell wall biosynthesis